jgi:hypothetical protein
MFDLTPMQWKQVAAFTVLVVAVALVLRSLIVRDRRQGGFSFESLLLDENGKSSSARAVFLGSFGVTTWALIYAMLVKDNPLDYFQAYIAAWVVAKSADAFATRAKPEPEK